ncbi:Coenzyme F420 hydrogenase/dehydrogenase, beta subunit C-terminal domain [Haloarchaeobius sp. HME9146]|uniref:Coenzyme F420 hydrogenase/dehydrogenase, beta subunit C-terminal domain n=1 Tax=Haloarchaeobius sp. HME9146 TaxID=2978732 RepID=UPI0021C0BBC1|nr:Coenzyme F420 hydrogenase/dehydrogenase, beta subunit C-terminal domain [Haloarchaeobius sp. HME9146]MCT9097525.1 Coenzyme F420 hydrogenase/dehydrogenase, beta subunit C-terminal domain [Haloarchaeobius sp. HME9146]
MATEDEERGDAPEQYESVIPADVAPELTEPGDGKRERDPAPVPHVPETDRDAGNPTVPTVSTSSSGGDAGCSGDTCTCGDAAPVTDGGSRPVNVDADGSLGDLSFTRPAENTSQNVDDGDPATRVQLPDGASLETPPAAIRSEMNDIETPDGKTWFMELDEAVIDEGRCIQCGTCVAACPSDSIGIGDDDLPELVKMCTGCSLCWDFCPRGGLRYERQWTITGGEDNVTGAGDPITEFSARVDEDWREGAQDGGVVTSVLSHLLAAGEIDGALIATESDDEEWKAEPFLATSHEDLVANSGSFYNQTMALGSLDPEQWADQLPDKDPEDLSLALVGTPCEIEGIRALQDFEWEYGAQEAGVRAIDYTIALMCTKNFNYYSLIGEQLAEKRGISPADIGKLDVLHGKLLAYDHDGDLLVEEDVKNFHDAALKGCSECADFTGYCADLTVGSVGSSDEFSSVIVRTEQGLKAWELTEPDLVSHDLEDRSAIGKLQSWDKKQAFEALQRPFDPDAPRFIEYTEHAEYYGTSLNPHEHGH